MSSLPAAAVAMDAAQRARLLSYARSRFGISAADAEDILQDTLLELLRRQAVVHSPEGFVFSVFRSRCGRHLAATQGRREVFREEDAPDENVPHAENNETIDRQVALRQAMGGISSVCRRILCAFYIEGRSLRETAQTLAVAPSGVTKTINRCLRRLRACLN